MPASYFAPIFCYGRTSQVVATAPAAAGASTIAISNGGGVYAVGDQVFVSEAGGTEIEFLGRVLQASGSSIVTENKLLAAKSASFLVWKPTVFYRFTYGQRFDESREIKLGVNTRVSRGGTVYATRVSDSVTKILLTFKRGLIADFKGFRDFIVDNRRDGIDPFTLAYWDGSENLPRVSRVLFEANLRGASDDQSPEQLSIEPSGLFLKPISERGCSDFAFRFLILSLNSYVTS